MKLTALEINNFRNIENLKIKPCENVNVIFGENAQGKTNLLESIWLFTGCKSFRGAKDSELVSFGKESAKLELDFFAENRKQYMRIEIDNRRRMSKNSVPYKSRAKAMGDIRCVVFSPVHLNLIKEGPSERRRFLDIAISQIKPNYAILLTEYNKALKQRNALLKDIAMQRESKYLIDIWDERLAFYDSKLAIYRLSYINSLKEIVGEIYSGISSDREKISIEYKQKGLDEIIAYKEEYKRAMFMHREEDIATRTTTIGVHRDDLEICIDGVSARKFASQGQQRSAALALKLAEANLITAVTGEQPIALLDDVMSELDISRQDYILNHIKDWQVFITCCDPNTIKNFNNGRAFEIKDGKVISTFDNR